MATNKLLDLIQTGEYLEKKYNDDSARNKWVVGVKAFLIDNKYNEVVSRYNLIMVGHLSKVEVYGSGRIGRNNFYPLMDYLRHIYEIENDFDEVPQVVVILHKYDDTLIDDIETCVRNAECEPIILQEKTGRGNIIEQLEDCLANL